MSRSTFWMALVCLRFEIVCKASKDLFKWCKTMFTIDLVDVHFRLRSIIKPVFHHKLINAALPLYTYDNQII